jgi:hypothetical protein
VTFGSEDEGDFRLDPIKLARQHEEFMKALETGGRIPSKPAVILPERPTIRSEFVKTRTGGRAGPYFYAYWREGKKVKKKYLGKHLPEHLRRVFNYQAEDSRRNNADISAAMSSMFDDSVLK